MNLYDRNQTIDPQKLMESYPGINKAFEEKNEKWKQKYVDNPDSNPQLEIGKNFIDNIEFNEEYEKYLNREGLK